MLEVYFRPLRGYFGEEHISALLHLLSESMPSMIQLLYSYTQDKLLDLKDIFEALGEAMMFDPNRLNPKSSGEDVLSSRNNTVTSFEDIKDSLQDIIQFGGLKPEIFHTFRECGNIIAFFLNFVNVLDSQQCQALLWVDEEFDEKTTEALKEVF